MKSFNQSANLYQESSKYFPGGVNSPVRAFKSVEGKPLFIVKGDGPHIWDADDNKYIDFCASWGPLILGHNHPNIYQAVVETAKNGLTYGAPTIQENKLAKLILENNRFIEKIRFVSSGTEAVMSAIRLARGYTNRNKIIKFEGCYHGHADHLLVKAGSGLVTFGSSSSAGVPASFVNETIVLPLNNTEALKEAFSQFKNEIACVIIEPIPANNGLLLQEKSYLEFLRNICSENGSLLIFDEVISGFRVGFEGAAGYYNIAPDLVTYGKIIGGGMPVGAYGASADIMSHVAPEGNVYQAGTLSGNPVAMAAGVAQLSVLNQANFYAEQEERTLFFVDLINKHIEAEKLPIKIFTIGSIFWMAFSSATTIRTAEEIDVDSMKYFKKLHHYLLQNGVYFGPSGYEVGFVSQSHTKNLLSDAAQVINKGLTYTFS